MSKALPTVIAALLGGVALVPVYYATQNPEPVNALSQSLKSDFNTQNASAIEKLSYALGYEVATQTPQLEIQAFIAGANSGHRGEKSYFSAEEISMASKQFAIEQQLAEETKQTNTSQLETQADSFLSDNAKKPNVKTTPSGLQYTIEQEGTGKSPKATDIVKVNYEGKLTNGDVFDSSFERGQPIEFPLNQVIPGWTEGLQLMKEGGKYTFFIPAELGYGSQGTGPIPPNSTLIFKVELIEVK